MTKAEYDQSIDLAAIGYSFAALIMGAMRQADNYNLEQLKFAFPVIWTELQKRYHAPSGVLEGETGGLER